VRIVSLLPSATELVAALGLADRLVGVSAECDYPPEIEGLPVVTASRVDTAALASREIDAAVRAALAAGRSLYAVDAELVERLAPDVVLTQDLCEVCAVSSSEVCGLGVDAVALDARTLDEVAEVAVSLAARLGVRERGEELAADFRRRLREVAARVRGLRRARVVVAEWLDPPFAAGHWIPELVAVAGGVELIGRPGEPSFATTWRDVEALEPDLVLLAPCGFDAARAAAEAVAVPLACRLVAVDANAYYSRPGLRLAHGAEQLAFLLHPDEVPDPGLPWRDVTRAVTA
jgi:iron complex transport system substrate-binding protein